MLTCNIVHAYLSLGSFKKVATAQDAFSLFSGYVLERFTLFFAAFK